MKQETSIFHDFTCLPERKNIIKRLQQPALLVQIVSTDIVEKSKKLW